ncbi:MAG: hypothetical protein EBR82_70835 [Caulobacteraceae bacterium]|nr:hypothetical protein [Caulobacteraceae bacterium]
MNDFVVFILTHGRADNVITAGSLKKAGYTGRIVFVIDNEDKQADKYYANFGRKNVIMFDKKKYADECDECNNFDERRTITMARNACFDIAESIGVKYFVEMDDDYTAFDFRIPHEKKGTCGIVKPVKNLDLIFELYVEFYKDAGLSSVAFSQGGDFIGGVIKDGKAFRFSKRKCMNTFFLSTERRFKFVGAMNEDVNTYTTLGSRGHVFMTAPFISITQKATQSQAGGITEMYKRFGTYCKAFTTVMNMPSSVKVKMMGDGNSRLHHGIDWQLTVPKILDESHKKA